MSIDVIMRSMSPYSSASSADINLSRSRSACREGRGGVRVSQEGGDGSGGGGGVGGGGDGAGGEAGGAGDDGGRGERGAEPRSSLASGPSSSSRACGKVRGRFWGGRVDVMASYE